MQLDWLSYTLVPAKNLDVNLLHERHPAELIA